jgi:hypothetical protein
MVKWFELSKSPAFVFVKDFLIEFFSFSPSLILLHSQVVSLPPSLPLILHLVHLPFLPLILPPICRLAIPLLPPLTLPPSPLASTSPHPSHPLPSPISPPPIYPVPSLGATDSSRVRLGELTLLMEEAWLSAPAQGDTGHRLSQFLATARFGLLQQVRLNSMEIMLIYLIVRDVRSICVSILYYYFYRQNFHSSKVNIAIYHIFTPSSSVLILQYIYHITSITHRPREMLSPHRVSSTAY